MKLTWCVSFPAAATCFFLGILFASFPYDFPLLWSKAPVSADYYDQLETHLKWMHQSPPLIGRILNIMVTVGFGGLFIKLFRPSEANFLFDGASLILYTIGVAVYVSNIVKGLRAVSSASRASSSSAARTASRSWPPATPSSRSSSSASSSSRPGSGTPRSATRTTRPRPRRRRRGSRRLAPRPRPRRSSKRALPFCLRVGLSALLAPRGTRSTCIVMCEGRRTIPKGRERGEGNGRGKGSRRRAAGLFCMYASHPTTIRAAARVPSPWDDPAMLNPAIGHLPALRKAWTRVPVRVLITYVVVAVGHAWPARRWRRPCVHNKCCLFLASLANPRATRAETQQASKQASQNQS